MNNNNNFVSSLANRLVLAGTKISNIDLANQLNNANLKISYGSLYKGKRGTFRLISTTYWKLDSLGRISDRDNIAKAFTNFKGYYAYL